MNSDDLRRFADENQKEKIANIGSAVVVDMDYLTKKDALDKNETQGIIVKQAAVVAAIVVLLVCTKSSVGEFFFWLFGSLFFIGIYWFGKVKKNNKNQKNIANKNFRLMNTTLTDKKKDVTTDGDGFTSKTYSLIFDYYSTGAAPYEQEVSEIQYRSRIVGDECFLLLYWNEKKQKYILDNVFWKGEAVISEELEKYCATEEEIACENSRKLRGAQVCSMKTSDEDGQNICSMLRDKAFAEHFGMKPLEFTEEILKSKIQYISAGFITAPSQLSAGEDVTIKLYIDNKKHDTIIMIESKSAKNTNPPDIKRNRQNVDSMHKYIESYVKKEIKLDYMPSIM